MRQHLSYVSSGPFQWAFAEGLRFPDAYFDEFRAALAAQRDHLTTGLAGLGLRPLTTQGTYFLTTDVTGAGFDSGTEFCDWIPGNAGWVAIPLSALSDHPDADPYVRWAFCKREATLDEALTRLDQALA
ncbi:MAG: aminotransferase class I/II-fold pyridoxal phosphate-dependent enzyme [Candidatus Nanopelagicales bacterium]